MNKNIFLLGLCAAAMMPASADDYNYMTIEVNGSTVSYPIADISKVTFTADDQTQEADYTLRVLTFEDADYVGAGNFLGEKNWSSLIDSPQYGGPLLYGDFESSEYFWYDDENTGLFAAIDPEGDGLVYWSGGEAVSNYVNPNYATEVIGYTEQLATPAGGHNGTKNFCVHNGYFDGVFYNKPSGGICFADDVAHVIDHMWVSLTSYGLSAGILGSASCPKATDKDWVKLVAIGTDANGATKQVEISMCEGGVFEEGWVKWDLSSLGEIVRLDFNVTSSLANEWGMCFPGYFAYDDIAVRFPKK